MQYALEQAVTGKESEVVEAAPGWGGLVGVKSLWGSRAEVWN